MPAPGDSPLTLLLLLCLLALCLALALTPAFQRIAIRLRWFDRPDARRKLHPRPVPRAGGVPLMAACWMPFGLLALLPAGGASGDALALAAKLAPAALAIFATGLLDDLVHLKPLHKLAGQLLGAALACWSGIVVAGAGQHSLPPWIAVPLTVLWLTACTNAFNLIDGIDGLAAGAGLIAALTSIAAGLALGNAGLALAAAPLAGALLGFLRYNFNPACVFLGDSGALTLGFLLGCYGILWSESSATPFALVAPVMALSVPLLDTTLSVARRILRRRPVFSADREHVHHKLLARGLTQRRAALICYAACGIAGLFALVENAGGAPAVVASVLFCLAVWCAVRMLGYAEFVVAGRLIRPASFLRVVDAQVRLRALEQELRDARNTEQCWDAIATAGREFGFARVVLRLGETARDEWLRPPEPDGTCWTMRIPLSPAAWVNITGEFRSTPEPLLLGRLAEVLRTALEPRLSPAEPATVRLRATPAPLTADPAPAACGD